MKTLRWMIVVLLVVLLAGPVVFAASMTPMGIEGVAVNGGTHLARITFADLDETTTNTADTVSFAVPANKAVEFVGIRLVKAFDTSNTNYTGSVALTIGDGSDADLFLESMELASDGTEVFYKFPHANGGTISVTPQTAAITTTVYSVQTANVGTNGEAVVTNIVASSTAYTVATNAAATYSATSYGRTYYAGATNIVFTFTPNAQEALSANTQGEIEAYFSIKP